MKANKTIKGYKAFNKDMTCRGKQYSENTEFVENVELEPCESGMHFCRMPLDVLNYYSPINSVFAPVEATGDIKEYQDKIVTNKLKIGTKMSLRELINAHFKLIKSENNSSTTGYASHSSTTGDRSHSCTTGYASHSCTNGNYSHSCTNGNYSHSCTTGYKSHSCTTGYASHSCTTGNGSHSCTNGYASHSCTNGYASHSSTTGYASHSSTTGYASHSSTTGYASHSSTTGDRSHSCTNGDNAIACSLGIKSRAMVVNGWLILVDWRYGESVSKWYINNIHSAKVGDKILGTKIEPNTWYWFEDGELKQELAEK